MSWSHSRDALEFPKCPPKIGEHLPYPPLMEDRSYPPVSGEPLVVHVERLSVTRRALLDCADRDVVEDFRTLRPSGDNQVTPEWVIEHLAQTKQNTGARFDRPGSLEKGLSESMRPTRANPTRRANDLAIRSR